MIRTIGIVLGVLAIPVAGLLIYAATRPDTFRVQRTANVNAPPEKVFALINDFRNWSGWSPYETKDPAMKRTLSGAASGKGAVYAWDGDKNVGTGRMEIADASPSRVTINLDFEKPFKANNIAEFTMQPQGGGVTNVTWALYGQVPYFAKIVHIFFDMDRMVGQDFEAGLAKLKAAAEK